MTTRLQAQRILTRVPSPMPLCHPFTAIGDGAYDYGMWRLRPERLARMWRCALYDNPERRGLPLRIEYFHDIPALELARRLDEAG